MVVKKWTEVYTDIQAMAMVTFAYHIFTDKQFPFYNNK